MKRLILNVPLIFLFTCIVCCDSKSSSPPKIERISDRFFFKDRMSNDLMDLTLRSDNGKIFSLKDPKDLRVIYRKLCSPDTPFLEYNINGNRKYLICEVVFDDKATLSSEAELNFFTDRIYFGMNFSENGGGFGIGDPKRYIRLDPLIDGDVEKEIRNSFDAGTTVKSWKESSVN